MVVFVLILILCCPLKLFSKGFSVSAGVAAKVGHMGLCLTEKALQRYKAAYLVADSLARKLFNDALVYDGDVVGVMARGGAGHATLVANFNVVTEDEAWANQRKALLAKLAMPTSLLLADQGNPPFYNFFGNPAVNDVRAAVFADGADHYAFVPEGDVIVSSPTRTNSHGYVMGALEAFVRVVFSVHSRISVGAEAGWSFGLGEKTRLSDISYPVQKAAPEVCSSVTGGQFASPMDLRTFAYEAFGYHMISGAYLDVEVQRQQRFSLVLQARCSKYISLSFLCGMCYTHVECLLGGGKVSFPYGHMAFEDVHDDIYRVSFDGLKCSGGAWAPVFGVNAECVMPFGLSVGLGFEYSSFSAKLKEGVKNFDNPLVASVDNYGVAYGWHMNRVERIEQALVYKIDGDYVSVALTLFCSL